MVMSMNEAESLVEAMSHDPSKPSALRRDSGVLIDKHGSWSVTIDPNSNGCTLVHQGRKKTSVMSMPLASLYDLADLLDDALTNQEDFEDAQHYANDRNEF